MRHVYPYTWTRLHGRHVLSRQCVVCTSSLRYTLSILDTCGCSATWWASSSPELRGRPGVSQPCHHVPFSELTQQMGEIWVLPRVYLNWIGTMQLRWRQKNYMLHAIVCHHVKMSIQLDSGITTSIIIELLKKVKKGRPSCCHRQNVAYGPGKTH
jgi:hypothetical protein